MKPHKTPIFSIQSSQALHAHKGYMTDETLVNVVAKKILTAPAVVETQAAAVEVAVSHFSIWQAAQLWSEKLEDSLKAEFAQFVEQYKNLI